MTSLKCQICNAITKTKYRNVLCCESCKAFFRRTHSKENSIRCPFAGKCEIETATRKFCRACRLQKCYTVFLVKCQKFEAPKQENNCDLLGQPLPIPPKFTSIREEDHSKSIKFNSGSICENTMPLLSLPIEYQLLLNHLIQVQILKNTEYLLKQNFEK